MNAELRRSHVIKKHLAILVPLIVLTIGTGAAPLLEKAGGVRLHLRSGSFDPRSEQPPALPDAARQLPAEAKHLARGMSRFVLVQFEGPIRTETQDAIRSTGAEVVRYMPDFALLVRADKQQLGAISQLPSVRWVGSMRPSWRVEPKILNSFSGPPSARVQWAVVAQQGESVNAIHQLILRSFPDVELLKGGVNDHKLVLRTSAGGALALLAAILEHESVAWIEPWIEPHVLNNESIWVVQSGVRNAGDIGTLEYPNSAPVWAHDILGTGQIVAVADSGLTDNDCFFSPAPIHQNVAAPGAISVDLTKRKLIAYNWFPGAADGDSGDPAIGYHGSHVAGSVQGDNSANLSTATAASHDSGDGMAPNAKLIFQDIGGVADLAGIPLDLRDMFAQAYAAGARVHTNSWGSGVEGIYTSDSQAVDDYNYRMGQDMLILFAASNDGAGVNGDKLAGGENDTIGSPGTAKNSLTVGAVDNGSTGANTLVWFSSRGQTDDGRTKPEIVAPGFDIVSHDGDATACNTQQLGGTSMATPTVAGAATLARQYFTDGWYPSGAKTPADGFAPTAAALRATLTAGARPITTEGYCDRWSAIFATCTRTRTRAMTASPNSMQGWGRLTLIDSLWFNSAPNSNVKLKVWDVENSAGNETGQVAEYSLPGVVAGTRLHINLAWSDAPGTLGAAKALVNDLNLEVIAPNGTTIYHGNQFSVTADGLPRDSAAGAAGWDSTNNLEGVQIAAPANGDYLIRIHAFNVPGYSGYFQDRQGYAIAATGNFTQSCALPAPTGLNAVAGGANQINLSWTAVPGATKYAIYRSLRGQANCNSGMAQIGQSTTTNFTDNTVIGGYQYSYYVKTLAPCDGPASNCATATATGSCSLKPTFPGVTSATSASDGSCAIDLAWSAATSNCPLGNSVVYNIYRSTTPNFTVAPANLVGSCVNALSYTDGGLTSGTTYFYVVRAEDSTTGNGGPCGSGNEESNNVIASATPYGVGTGASGTWTDGGGDTSAKLTREGSWSIVSTADSATYVHSGTYAYKTSPGTTSYPSNACAAAITPTLTIGTANPTVTFWERHAVEDGWDGVTVEYSVNGGAWTVATAGTTACFDASGASGANGCGLVSGTQGYENNGGSATTLTAWAQRTFNITSGVGNTVAVRWRLASDTAVEELGFVLDDIAITNIALPNPCTACTPPSAPTGVLASPAGVDSVDVNWNTVAGATEYRIYRSSGSCPGGAYTQIGTAGAGATSYSDTTVDCNTSYSYKVSAFLSCESALSACDDAAVPTPGVPTLTNISTPAFNTIRLDWTAGSPAGTTFNVYRSDGSCPGGAFTLLDSGLTATTFDDTTVTGGQTYSYQVSAVGPNCESAQSNCLSTQATGGPGLFSTPLLIAAQPIDTTLASGPRWLYVSGASALNPPTLNSAVYAASNDRRVHSMAIGATGGMWPRTSPKDWKPLLMNAPSQARIPVTNLTVDIAGTPTLIRAGVVASQDGRVYLLNADTGALVWTSAVLGEMLQAAPGGYVRAFDPNAVKLANDILIIGTRNSASANVIYGLNAATGAVLWSFDNGGGGSAIGVINGAVMTDTPNRRVYFASRKHATGSTDTLWCLSFTASSASLIWSTDVGDIDSSPILKGTSLYVGNNAGTMHKFNVASGTPSVPVWTYVTSDGPIKHYPVVDWSSTAVYASTTNQVWRFIDNGLTATLTWSTPASGVGSIASPSSSMLWGTALYVGSSTGNIVKLTNLTAASPTETVIPVGGAAIGGIAFDYTNNLMHAGSEAGTIYAVTP